MKDINVVLSTGKITNGRSGQVSFVVFVQERRVSADLSPGTTRGDAATMLEELSGVLLRAAKKLREENVHVQDGETGRACEYYLDP